ncbi:NADH-quinone oxidoreductase subunit N [Anaeromyxobacter sp. PSR-1]|uniref:NADH-quinone oxidoreductase subunit N n=1 Tax=unclassified Anaeromyxobacter TaxID=2620896 RepID=UPI0005DCB811|nr:NADH-quinone oxidoreductase subunit N [Anaeromyxobacter sp. PSR-1]GAO03541.1 NADH-quinone oxidoreductase subunit N [Anaeromyxobacter sp. PSR-1]
MSGFPIQDFVALVPVAILTMGALVLLMTEVFLTSGRRAYQAYLTMVFAAAAAAYAAWMPVPGNVFGRQAVVDSFSAFVTVVLCAGLALSALVGQSWLNARNSERGEFYALALFGTAGMVLLGMATDLLIAFIAVEVMSLSTYCLAAFLRRGKKPAEAAFKYVVLGSISSALLLYGSALLYGASGSTLFSLLPRGQGSALYLAGIALVAGGVAFKIAAVPFHAWTPDVYEGAPTPVTAFMAAGVKTAAFAVLVRLFLATESGSAAMSTSLGTVLSALAVLTMIFGNLLALPQRSVKRMLAYSSIGHAGYLLVGVVSAVVAGARDKALAGLLFYLAAYTATVIGAFAVVGALERRTRGDFEPADAWDLDRFAGLARRRPALAFAMAVFLFSLAGVPPTAGFIGKFYIFKAAMGAGLYGLAVLGVLTSVLGAYYYLRVVLYMYFLPSKDEAGEVVLSATSLTIALAAAVAVVVLLGVVADPMVRLAQAASAIIL